MFATEIQRITTFPDVFFNKMSSSAIKIFNILWANDVCTFVRLFPILQFQCPRLLQRKLRSVDTRTLLVSRTRTIFGDRAFSAAGPRLRKICLRTLWKTCFQPFNTADIIEVHETAPQNSYW